MVDLKAAVQSTSDATIFRMLNSVSYHSSYSHRGRYYALKKVVDFEHALHSYVRANNAALMDKINETADYNDEIEAGLRSAIEDFKANASW